MPESAQEAYERGALAGEISARLAGHDAHFAAINGHLATLAVDFREIKLSLQRMADQRESDLLIVKATAEAVEKTVRSTAASLEDSRAERRHAAERDWSPYQRLFTVVAALATLAGLVALLISL